jgi:hypothetical protein
LELGADPSLKTVNYKKDLMRIANEAGKTEEVSRALSAFREKTWPQDMVCLSREFDSIKARMEEALDGDEPFESFMWLVSDAVTTCELRE